ncbi:MAG: hypothetical protein FWG30_08975 [Eubacteriaceae bacterium]|nr:hypothetical protein [Eubacteriaceae bacterium]
MDSQTLPGAASVQLKAINSDGYAVDLAELAFQLQIKRSRLNLAIGSRAQDIVSSMSVREKVCQMLFVEPSQIAFGGRGMQAALAEFPVGGIIYFSNDITSQTQISELIAQTQSFSKVPLFIGVDEEGGSVARISGNTGMGFREIDSMLAIGDRGNPKEAYEAGSEIARNIRRLGFNVDFAPVADIAYSRNASEIGDRSFGSNASLVSKMVEQAVLGMQDAAVSSTIKHFPGYGSAQTDSHLGRSVSSRGLDDFRKEDLLPFSAGIKAGSDFVMVSHMSAIGIDDSLPSSLSPKIITDLLKNELGFKKIVITDSLKMGAVTTWYTASEAAVMSIKAGADMLLMPDSVSEALDGVMHAIKSGIVSEELINESALKIIQLKLNRGIIK